MNVICVSEVDPYVMTTRSGLSIKKVPINVKPGSGGRNSVSAAKDDKPGSGSKKKHSIVKYKSMSYMSFVTRFYLCLRVPELDLAGVNPREALQYLEDCPLSGYDEETSADETEDEADEECQCEDDESGDDFTLSVAEDVNNNEKSNTDESKGSVDISAYSYQSSVPSSQDTGELDKDETSSVYSESGSDFIGSDDVFYLDSEDTASTCSETNTDHDFSPMRHKSDSAYELARLRLSELQLNLVRADGGKLLKCQDCDEVFSTPSAFTAHIKSHAHSKNKCDVCGKVFTRSWLLKGHRRTHTGERPFPCPHKGCQKAFADKSNLRSHFKIHTTTHKNYACKKCGRAFAQKRYLHKHMLEVCRLI